MSEIEEKSDITTPLVKSGVEKMIQVIRGKQVLFDRDLATLYGVETKYINRAVKRNPKRFPDEFYFQLTKEEFFRRQVGTLNMGRGMHSRSCQGILDYSLVVTMNRQRKSGIPFLSTINIFTKELLTMLTNMSKICRLWGHYGS